MAPNSSSVFNEAPTEAKPSSTGSDMAASTESRPVATVTTSPTECNGVVGKQAAPKMEPTIEENGGASSPTSSSASSIGSAETGSSLRFARVAAVGLDESKKTITFRKSCLKRSSSFFPSSSSSSSLPDIALDSVKVEKVELIQQEATAAKQKEEDEEEKATTPVQKNRRRCWECKAKVGLTALTCRCDFTFCSKHRYAEEHNCRFNFRGAAKRKLEDENPRVVPCKVARIN